MRKRYGPLSCAIGAVLVWGAILAADLYITDEPGMLGGRWHVLRAVMLWWLLLVPAVLFVRRAPRRLGVALVLAGLIGLQIAGMQRPTSVLSDDAYRYAFEGRVQAAGVDPYRYPPTAPELARFRDPWLFPDQAGCAAIGRDPGCTRINYKDERTIYPPVAEAWFLVVHALPGPQRDGKQQLYAGLVGLALTLLLMRELAVRGRSPAEVAWYAWSPMAGLDVASDAHVDVLAALLAVVALTLARRSRAGWAGVAIGAAVAVKLYPALLIPALLGSERMRSKRVARLLGAATALVAVSYLPHVAAVGVDVLGFLPRYLSVEGYSEGTRYLLLRLIPGPTKVYVAFVLAGLAWAAWRGRIGATELVGGALLVATPVQTWYALMLVAIAVLEARPQWLAVAAAAYPLYNVGPIEEKQVVGAVWYGIAAAVVLGPPFLRWCMRDNSRTDQGPSDPAGTDSGRRAKPQTTTPGAPSSVTTGNPADCQASMPPATFTAG